MEDRETDGGKKQRGMNQRVKRHRGGGRMLGDTLELCQLQDGKCVCVCDRRTDRGSVLILPASLLCKLHVTHPASPRGKSTAASSPSSSSFSSTHSNMKPRPSASGHNLILLCLVWSDNKVPKLSLSALWKNGNHEQVVFTEKNRLGLIWFWTSKKEKNNPKIPKAVVTRWLQTDLEYISCHSLESDDGQIPAVEQSITSSFVLNEAEQNQTLRLNPAFFVHLPHLFWEK